MSGEGASEKKTGIGSIGLTFKDKTDELGALLIAQTRPATPTPAPTDRTESTPDTTSLFSVEATPSLESENEAVLRMTSPSSSPSLTAHKRKAPNTTTPSGALYTQLAKMITHKNIEAESGEEKSLDLRHRLDNILPVVEHAYTLAQSEQEKATVRAIKDMMLSLGALAKNKTRYEEAYFTARLNDILQNVPDGEEKNGLREALTQVVEDNLFHKRKFYQTASMGSTAFDAKQVTLDIEKYPKRVKFQHSDNGKVVTAHFSFNRSLIRGHTSAKIWRTRESEYGSFRRQVKEFVDVSVGEYNKGSPNNPFHLRYTKGSPPIPEAALACLIELKKRAVLEQRDFHMKDKEGKPYVITKSEALTPAELTQFMAYASEKPPKEDHSGGYYLCKQAGMKVDEPIKEEAIKTLFNKELLGAKQALSNRVNSGKEAWDLIQNNPSALKTQSDRPRKGPAKLGG